MNWLHLIQHWLTVHTGSSNMPGVAKNYNFWSGSGSDIGEIALFGAILAGWHRVNCHQKGCWRIGREQLAGTTWHLCRRHHPAGKPTAEDIAAQTKGGAP